jgi:RNase H-fold protein (predicted Holliday junction resolvase)
MYVPNPQRDYPELHELLILGVDSILTQSPRYKQQLVQEFQQLLEELKNTQEYWTDERYVKTLAQVEHQIENMQKHHPSIDILIDLGYSVRGEYSD